MTVTTVYSESEKRHIDFTDQAAMPRPRLKATIDKYARKIGGGTDATLEAMRAELAKREAEHQAGEGASAPTTAAAPASKAGAMKLERADGTTTSSADNLPSDQDPFILNLQDTNEKILTQIAEHELAAADLPKAVNSDDDVEKITAWVVTARSLYRDTEKAFKVAKAPHLENGRKVDGFFATLKENLASRATSLEGRNAPYLKAKREREQAEREAQAAQERERQRLSDEEARKAREREEQTRREADEAARKIKEAADEPARRQAELDARAAEREAQNATREADAAAHDAAAAAKTADKAERVLDGSASLEKTTAGGGSVKLTTVGKYRVDDMAAVKRSLGNLGQFFTDANITDALARAAKAEAWPRVPGVHFYEEEEVKTTAQRAT